MRTLIIIALLWVIGALIVVIAAMIEQKNNMQIKMTEMQSKSDSLYDEIIPLKFQNQRYEFIYDQLSTNPEVQKAFNETE
jgi:beta-lactamase regulating signal transducer with metallopeptidase domain